MPNNNFSFGKITPQRMLLGLRKQGERALQGSRRAGIVGNGFDAEAQPLGCVFGGHVRFFTTVPEKEVTLRRLFDDMSCFLRACLRIGASCYGFFEGGMPEF